MHVEVNETNIDKFNLVELTGNTREAMLSRAAEASEAGHVLSVDVPDELVLEQNVFDVYESEAVDPRRLDGLCHYDKAMREDQFGIEHTVYVCVVHGQESKYLVDEFSAKPCQEIEPLTVPKLDHFTGKSCSYSTIQDPHEGTMYFCILHGARSKYDIANNPGLPCLAVDPE